jgi:hypothetical protein
MRLLGFYYDLRKKSFYVDGHKLEDVVANCKKFCIEHLTEYEPYCRRGCKYRRRKLKPSKTLTWDLGLTITTSMVAKT